jgi:cysteine sulfinate desulfinase/cysteine desulfurase-like protein
MFRAKLRRDTAVVTVMLANNQTGIAEIAAAAHVQGAAIHSDAARPVGRSR